MDDPCDPTVYPPTSLTASVEQLNSNVGWFRDPDRPPETGPFVVVVDDFYSDPDQIRRIALDARFFQYLPPAESQIGAKVSSCDAMETSWFSTALVRRMGEDVRSPEIGFRYNPPELRRRFEDLLNESVV